MLGSAVWAPTFSPDLVASAVNCTISENSNSSDALNDNRALAVLPKFLQAIDSVFPSLMAPSASAGNVASDSKIATF